jgi:hypothetical protein
MKYTKNTEIKINKKEDKKEDKKEEIKEEEKYKCKCGSQIYKRNLNIHKKTDKHINYKKSQEIYKKIE